MLSFFNMWNIRIFRDVQPVSDLSREDLAAIPYPVYVDIISVTAAEGTLTSACAIWFLHVHQTMEKNLMKVKNRAHTFVLVSTLQHLAQNLFGTNGCRTF